MRMAIRPYRSASSWPTVLLLTLLVTGFGLFAQHRVSLVGNGLVSDHSDLIVTTGRK